MIEFDKALACAEGFAFDSGVAVFGEFRDSLPLLSAREMIRQMDEAGIAQSIIYAVDAPIVYASNEYVHRLCERYGDRLIGFASVNPMRSGAVEKFQRAIEDLSLRGLKLHPPLQRFFPNDESVFPLYEKAAELNVPVVFHVGTTPFGSLCRLAHANPLLIDDVAVAFPSLRIMLTHLGTLWHHEAFMVVEKNPNVYIDTAAYLYEIPEILTRDTVERIGRDKVIFGTDYPMPYVGRVHRMKDFVDALRQLDLPGEMLDGIFSGNVQAFLNGRRGLAPGPSAAEIMERARPYLEDDGGMH
ncbi:MAG TPA: amidohydrolase family protein [Phycisphaerae bacterium]|nr:amidohydrolase family protein [Phycisphaerae bacterium]